MSPTLTDSDRRLLDQLQREIPLTPRPFASIGEALAMPEETVLERVRALSGDATAPIRQVSAIFDSRALGYQSCLVAAKIDPDRIAEAAAIISQHPGVSHNYQREHEYNLWFTLATPPDSRLGLDQTAERLRTLSGAQQVRLMPAIKLYKIGVRFDLGTEGESPPAPTASARPEAPPQQLGEADMRMIRVLQQHLPIESRPFDIWAEQAGVTVDQLLVAATRYREQGIMRRFSAVLRHRRIGVSANAMGVWIVPPQRQDAFGEIAAQNPAVSHCYLRPTYPDWPYSIFTMVHGRSRDECEATLAAISLAGGIKEFTSLYSTVEFKKVRVRYFTGEIDRWESAHADFDADAVRGSTTG